MNKQIEEINKKFKRAELADDDTDLKQCSRTAPETTRNSNSFMESRQSNSRNVLVESSSVGSAGYNTINQSIKQKARVVSKSLQP